jgi:hypothetical protein
MKLVVLVLSAVVGASGMVAAEEAVAPVVTAPVHVTAAAQGMLGAHQYFNTGGAGAQLRIGARGTNRLGAEAVVSMARMSGGEGLGWAEPFEPRNTLVTVRVGPRWDVPLGWYELSAGLHAGWMTLFHDRNGLLGDVAFAFERRLTDRVRVGVFATGMVVWNGLYVEAGPAVRVFVGP